MMRSRRFLSHSARAALSSLLVLICSSCAPPVRDLYTRENLAESVQSLAQTKYDVRVAAKLVGRTLWLYVPLTQPIFIASDGRTTIYRRYDIRGVESTYRDGAFHVRYGIRNIPESSETQPIRYNPSVTGIVNSVWRAANDVVMNMDRRNGPPVFLGLVAADIRTGHMVVYFNHVDDMKKSVHKLISKVEYQHRTVEAQMTVPQSIGDTEGRRLNLGDIDLKTFVAEQIRQRLTYRFRASEMPADADIDAEVQRAVKRVLETYQFRDYRQVTLVNDFSSEKFLIPAQ